MNMRILCIIPARGGSKGVPKKNVKLLNGKPLLQYTYEFALKLNIFDNICLSTDSIEISSIGKNLGIEVPFLRPESISTDSSSSFEFIEHALNYFELNLKSTFDYVCLLQPTVPFRDHNLFLPQIKKFLNSPDFDTLISFREVPHQYNPQWLFRIEKNSTTISPLNKNGVKKRRQDLDKFYCRDGALYLFKTSNIRSAQSIYGSKIMPLILCDSNDFNIDTMNDWVKVEKYLENIIKNS
jgi:N-acylneuraminate cytidylyltransferase